MGASYEDLHAPLLHVANLWTFNGNDMAAVRTCEVEKHKSLKFRLTIF
jgi:hypothetical protein